MTPTVIDLEAESKRPEQWKRIQEIWEEPECVLTGAVGRTATRSHRIAAVLGVATRYLVRRVRRAHLDRPQRYEAFWARVGLMGR